MSEAEPEVVNDSSAVGNPEEPVNVPVNATVKPLDEDQLSFTMLMLQHYSLSGELLSQAKCQELYGVTAAKYTMWMGLSQVRGALEEGGVIFERFDTTPSQQWKSKSLTPKQYLVANTMLDLIDTRSDKKKLQDLKVSTTQYNAWLKDPVFQSFMLQRAENMMGDVQHEALLALGDKVRSGDIKAIQYFHEFTGRYVKQSDRGGTGPSAVDLQNLIIRIVEIITDEVDDPITGARIADRLNNLMTARTIAGKLIDDQADVIIVPEVAPNRVMTPELQGFLNTGTGVNG